MVGDLFEVSDLIHHLTQLPVGGNTHVSPAANGVMTLYIFYLSRSICNDFIYFNMFCSTCYNDFTYVCLAANVVVTLHIFSMSCNKCKYFTHFNVFSYI